MLVRIMSKRTEKHGLFVSPGGEGGLVRKVLIRRINFDFHIFQSLKRGLGHEFLALGRLGLPLSLSHDIEISGLSLKPVLI